MWTEHSLKQNFESDIGSSKSFHMVTKIDEKCVQHQYQAIIVEW